MIYYSWTHGHPPLRNRRRRRGRRRPRLLQQLQRILIADISTGIRRAGGGVAYLLLCQAIEQQNHKLTFGALRGGGYLILVNLNCHSKVWYSCGKCRQAPRSRIISQMSIRWTTTISSSDYDAKDVSFDRTSALSCRRRRRPTSGATTFKDFAIRMLRFGPHLTIILPTLCNKGRAIPC